MQQYVVIGQNPAPNSEMYINFQKDSKGVEYSNLTDGQGYNSIDLYVRKINGSSDLTGVPNFEDMIPTHDRYTQYLRNYIGKNLASIGYTSLGGDRLDKYGSATIELMFVTDNGIYIDINDNDQMKQYYVIAQNIEPNTEIKLIYEKDSSGNEYDNLIDSQTIEQVDLYLIKLK